MLTVVAKRGADLAAGVLISTKLGLQGPVFEIVQPDSGIITGNQKLDISVWIVGRLGDGVDPCNLATLGIASAS